MRNAAKWFAIASAQMFGIWCTIQLWRRIGPIVGLPGLAVWVGALYWLAHRWDKQANEEFFRELERRGWRPPPCDAGHRPARARRS
jgi:hypothetical protein